MGLLESFDGDDFNGFCLGSVRNVLGSQIKYYCNAAAGWNGLLDPVEPGLACGSDTAHLSILGYNPRRSAEVSAQALHREMRVSTRMR